MKIHGNTISECRCTICGTVSTVPRNHGRQREVGHIKTMWCWKCKNETDHEELKYNEFGEKSMSGYDHSKNRNTQCYKYTN